MAPEGQDAFYVLVPVPNNLSKVNWIKEGDKFKDLVLDKMDKTVLPGIKENVVSDFYLTPDYFEIDLATLYGSGFSIQPKFSQSAYFRTIINPKYIKIYTLWVLVHTQALECLEFYHRQSFRQFILMKSNLLKKHAKSFIGHFFCRVILWINVHLYIISVGL